MSRERHKHKRSNWEFAKLILRRGLITRKPMRRRVGWLLSGKRRIRVVEAIFGDARWTLD